jgi:hypothetical protein
MVSFDGKRRKSMTEKHSDNVYIERTQFVDMAYVYNTYLSYPKGKDKSTIVFILGLQMPQQ